MTDNDKISSAEYEALKRDVRTNFWLSVLALAVSIGVFVGGLVGAIIISST